MNFHPLENAMNGIGIGICYLFGLTKRIRFDDHQAADLVDEGAGQVEFSGLTEGFQAGQVGWAMDLALCLAIRPVKTQYHKFHRRVSENGDD